MRNSDHRVRKAVLPAAGLGLVSCRNKGDTEGDAPPRGQTAYSVCSGRGRPLRNS